MAILWPAAIGKPDDYVLFAKHDPQHPKRYIQNAGLDFKHDGVITKKEAAAMVRKTSTKACNPNLHRCNNVKTHAFKLSNHPQAFSTHAWASF